MAAQTTSDPDLLAGARRAIERHGWAAATLERIAAEAGVSRMTLHRRGVSRADMLAALVDDLEREHRDSLLPALAAPGTGRERLELALGANCDVAERNLELLAALSEQEHGAIFHEPDGNERGVLSRTVMTAPLQRLLIDGAADGSLAPTDAEEVATVLFNLVGHTYRHLRRGHGWPPERARAAVLSIALDGVSA